jgi:hypothetical protein
VSELAAYFSSPGQKASADLRPEAYLPQVGQKLGRQEGLPQVLRNAGTQASARFFPSGQKAPVPELRPEQARPAGVQVVRQEPLWWRQHERTFRTRGGKAQTAQDDSKSRPQNDQTYNQETLEAAVDLDVVRRVKRVYSRTQEPSR